MKWLWQSKKAALIRQNIQFWSKSYRADAFNIKKTIHFPTMICRSEGVSDPLYSYVRRTQDGVWLCKERENSFWSNNLRCAINVSRSADRPASELISYFEHFSRAALGKLNWVAMNDTVFDGSLETAYRLFLPNPSKR